jgi:Subtilase family
MRRFGRLASLATAAVITIGISVASLPAAGAQTAPAPRPASRSAAQEVGAGATPAACARSTGPHRARCYLALAPASRPSTGIRATTCTVDESAGYTPCNLQNAYGLTSAAAKDGKGNTVAVVDPDDDPNAASDLATYRSTYGLPPCTTANHCFTKVNQDGVKGSYPSPDAGFAQEISLDLDMVSAICPHCHILLVEANSNGFGDLGTAINEAVTLGAKVVSDSWGTGEFDGETGWDGNVDHPGVAVTFSSGDGAYAGGVQYPSASPYVTSVGGTELTPATNTRGWTEKTWVTPASPPTQGSGSGCSGYEPKPGWQHDTGCANRTTADVSAVAANVLSYDTYQASGWYYSFGTSVSSPIVAGVYGLANNPASITIPASAAYGAPAADLHDITKGSTGTCTPTYLCKAGKGYDGPTGLGTPKGIGAFKVPGTPPPSISGVSFSGSPSDPSITVTGANFGASPPIGTPETCQAGDTGDDYGSSGLWFEDTTQSWTAGQAGDCIGLIVTSWTSTQVVFGFGNEYANYPAVQSGDQIEVDVQGATFTGPLS